MLVLPKPQSTEAQKLSWLENRNLVSTLKVNNQDADITIDTGVDASMLTETSSAMLGLNVVGASEIWIDSAYITANTEVSKFMLLNLLAVVNVVCGDEFNTVKAFSKVFTGLGAISGIFTIDMKAHSQPVRLYALRLIAVV